jgi:2-methylcitrate dehydratase PrpD
VRVYPDATIDVATARVNIKVTLRDGRSYSAAYYPAKGATDNPLSQAELAAKFNECAQWGGVPRSKAQRAVEILLDLDRAESVDELMSCIIA